MGIGRAVGITVRFTSKVLIAPVVVIIGIATLARALRRRPTGRGFDDGGGTAGVREPRRPLPTTLTDAGAASRS